MSSPTRFTLEEFPYFLRERLYEDSGLVAILDPVRWGNLEKDLLQVSDQWTLLYRGTNVNEYYKVMPYAVCMREGDGFYPELVRRLGQECCVIAETADVESLDFSKFIKFLIEQLLTKKLSSTGIMKGTLPSNNPLDGE